MTELNPLPTEEAPAESKKNSHAFWGALALTGILLLASFYFLTVIFRQSNGTPGPINYIAMTLFLFAIVTTVASIVLTLLNKQEVGLKLTLYTLLVIGVTVAFLFQGRVPSASFSILFVSLIAIWWLFPKRSRNVNLIIAAAAFILMWVIEWINPSWRLQVEAVRVGPIAAIAFFIVLAAIVARQAWHGSLRSKLLVAFIGVTVIATGALGVFMYITSNNNLHENLERELTAQATDRATHIGNLLDEQVNALTTLSLNEALQDAVETNNKSYVGSAAAIQATLDELDEQWRAADDADNNSDFLTQWYLTNAVARELIEYQQIFPDNIEVFVTDVYGGLVGMTNRTSDYYQADEGWWQAAYNNGEGAVYIGAPEFDESAGAVAVQIALPLRNQDTGKIIGILRTTYIVTPLADILTVKVGQTGEADLYIPGEVITHFHEGKFGPAKTEEFEALQTVADQGLVEMEYGGISSVVTQAQVQTLVGNPFVDRLGWVVVFHQQRDEAFAPVTAATRGFMIVLISVIALAAAVAFGFSLVLARPIVRLTTIAEEVSAGNLDSRAEVVTADEVGTLATVFNTMTSRLQETLQGLEQRVAERTQNLELAAEVGRSVSQVRALNVMLRDACRLILESFDLYYVQVYLTDPSQTNLVLEAGTGDVGTQLLGGGHSLPLSTASINGRAAMEKRTVVISDTSRSATFRPNPLLPDTRGEMAVPLIIGENVVGVLDMQTTVPGKLKEEVLPAFEALAGQLAVAVQNAKLVAEAEEARAEVEAQARRLVRAGWQEHLDAIHKPEQLGFVFDRNEVTLLEDIEEAELPEDAQAVSAPISLTGEMLGSLVVEIDEERQNEQTSELVNTVARQVAQQLENLRLLESSERYRFEAEQAARRQTREGWQEYMKSRTEKGLGFLYDLNEVRTHSNGKDDPEAMTLPLKARDETVGKLSVQGLDPNDHGSYDLANAVAERLGAHIESLRLFEETKQGQVELDRRAQQLAAVAEISTASSQELEVDKLLSTVVHLTQRQFGLYHTHIFTYDEAAEELRIAACGWKEGDGNEGTNESVSIPLDKEQSLVARAARTRQAVIVNDVKNEPGWLPNELLPDTASEMAVPLVIGDQVLGVMDVQSDRVDAFTEEDANIQMTLASQVATAMQNARSFAQAQKQAERESMLNTINQKIQSATSVEAVLQIAARELGHALGAPMTIAQLSMQEKN
jgi:GAF domain-containing protein/HAMP domain-containing protein